MVPLQEVDHRRFDTPAILRKVAEASRQLAELKGVASSIPNQDVLITTLALQEAKDSSAIENIITTHDEIFRDQAMPGEVASAAAKEVARYHQALLVGFKAVAATGLLTTNHILDIQRQLEQNRAGFRKLPGTVLKSDTGTVVYTPPQDPDQVVALMSGLERFINDRDVFTADPLVRMALIHHQFESIHPFYDGNGRTGRIICVLYLVKEGLLTIPILYLSRHIVRTKTEYYRRLQDVRDHDAWEAWVLYMLTAVEETARQAIGTVEAIREALLVVKHRIREAHRFYSQDLINSLFSHPYTTVEFLQRDLKVVRLTARKYLEALTADGILVKQRVGRTNYYINTKLFDILAGEAMTEGAGV